MDRRDVEEIRTGTATFGASYKGGGKGIIDSQKDVGGWPELRSLPAPVDTDHDDVPDVWYQPDLRVGGLPGSDSVSTRHPPLKPLPDPIPLKIQFPISRRPRIGFWP